MSRSVRRTVSIAVTLALMAAQTVPVSAYLKFGVAVSSGSVTLKWKGTVRYFVSDTGVPGVSPAALQSAAARAFSTWEAVPTASITYQFGGFTSALPGADDGRSTLGFLEEPELDRVLASTSFLIDMSTGELLESDIFFNSAFPWSVAPAGETGRYDLESIAVHEIGHLSGLGHSALGETEIGEGGRRRVLAAEAVMFPIAFGAGNTSGRALRADDIAGISDLYPDGRFEHDTGSISGRVTKNGRGVFGAHIVAFNPATGALVGNFSLDTQGRFSIAGLTPGLHIVRVEPLDDADVESFFDPEPPTDIDLRAAFYERLVGVPGGGDSGAIEIKVAVK
jgi:matrixin